MYFRSFIFILSFKFFEKLHFESVKVIQNFCKLLKILHFKSFIFIQNFDVFVNFWKKNISEISH